MQTKRARRGRPPKVAEHRKADYLDIRLEAAEKQAFREAAVVAGLDLSAWVRERLRASARKELEGVGKQAAFLHAGKPDRVLAARWVRPSSVQILFADGFSGTWSFRQLGLDMANVKAATIKAAAAGQSLAMKSKWNEKVELESSSLRAAVDPAYAAELEKAFLSLRGPLDDLTTNAMSLPLKKQRRAGRNGG